MRYSAYACTVLASQNKTCVSVKLATRENLRTRCSYIRGLNGSPIASLAHAHARFGGRDNITKGVIRPAWGIYRSYTGPKINKSRARIRATLY